MAKLPGNTLGSPSPALMEPTASPKAGGSSTSAPKQGCSLPSALAGACSASALLRVACFMGESRVSGRAQAVTLHGHSTLASAPAFAASPRLQWLCWGWDGALMLLPRSQLGDKSGQACLGMMGPNGEEPGPAGCWCGAGAWLGCPHAPRHPSTAWQGHSDMGHRGLGAAIGLLPGSEGLGGEKPAGCGCDVSPQHPALFSLARLLISRSLLCWGMLFPCSTPSHPAAVRPPTGTKGSSVCSRH